MDADNVYSERNPRLGLEHYYHFRHLGFEWGRLPGTLLCKR